MRENVTVGKIKILPLIQYKAPKSEVFSSAADPRLKVIPNVPEVRSSRNVLKLFTPNSDSLVEEFFEFKNICKQDD